MPVHITYSGPFKNFEFFHDPAIATITEIRELIEETSKQSFLEQKKSSRSSGALISSFEQKPITQQGHTIFKSMVVVGGPAAPYAPIVEHVGWTKKTGEKKSAYFFMRAGAIAGQREADDIAIKHFSRHLGVRAY